MRPSSRGEAEILGEEAWDAIAAFTEIWEKIVAVDRAHYQQTTTMRYGDFKGPIGGGILSRTGFEPHKARIGDLIRDLRTDLAKRVPA